MRARRTFIVLTLLIFLGFVLLWATTPEECRVAVEHMSEACKRLMFP
jgi:hypothetical protein